MIRNHVLVVEDDPAMQDLYETFFTVAHKDEFNWRLAEDGEKALRWLQRRPFDLIVLDRELPDMGGLDVLRWVPQEAEGEGGFGICAWARKSDEVPVTGTEQRGPGCALRRRRKGAGL